MAPLSCSKFHQLSGGTIYFCWQSHFKGEKCQQSEPIRNQKFLKERFPIGPLCWHFTHLKWDLQQKQTGPPESWWNSEQDRSLKYFSPGLLSSNKKSFETLKKKCSIFQCIFMKSSIFFNPLIQLVHFFSKNPGMKMWVF